VMGRDHARLAAAPALALALASHVAPAETLVAAACVAGAGCLPDLDEPGSSVARLFGSISEAVSSATNRWCGGHRQASHSLLAAALVGGLVEVLDLVRFHGVDLGVVPLGLCVALCLRVLLPWALRPGHILSLALAALVTWWAVDHLSLAWLPVWVAAGYVLHLVGDALTSGGVPLLWPWKRRFSIPLLGHTNSLRERVLGVALLLIVVMLALQPVGLLLVHHAHELATHPLPTPR